jgi:hypothetical protein
VKKDNFKRNPPNTEGCGFLVIKDLRVGQFYFDDSPPKVGQNSTDVDTPAAAAGSHAADPAILLARCASKRLRDRIPLSSCIQQAVCEFWVYLYGLLPSAAEMFERWAI